MVVQHELHCHTETSAVNINIMVSIESSGGGAVAAKLPLKTYETGTFKS